MIIPEFDKWFINEGFKADINADDKKENEIEIESPNEGNNNTYVINGDKVKTKKQKHTGRLSIIQNITTVYRPDR